MKESSIKAFLHISNVIISLMCVAAIVCYFLMPVFCVDISVRPTADTVRRVIGSKNSTALLDNVLESLEKEDIGADLRFSVTTVQLLRSLFTRSDDYVMDQIDGAIDQIIDNTQKIVSETAPKAVEVAAKEVIKSEIVDIAKKSGVGDLSEFSDSEDLDKAYESIMNDLGADGRKKAESLIDRLIKAITADDATVKSVSDVLIDGIDEAVGILSDSEKYSGYVQPVDESEKESIRESVSEVLTPYADENGKLILKDALTKMLLDVASEALSEAPSGPTSSSGTIKYIGYKYGGKEESTDLSEAVENLKDLIRAGLTDKIPDFALTVIHLVFMACAVLIIITLLMLAYPAVRSLTKIGSKNPGFILAAPIVAGIVPHLFTVIIPTITAKIIGSGAFNRFIPSSSGLSAADVSAVLSAFRVRFSSCTLVGFIVGLVLLVFCFFYGHYRRKLRKMQKSAA